MSRRKVSWSELPPELLTSIADHLECQTEIQKFQSVCKKWHTSTSFCSRHTRNYFSPILPHKFSITQFTSEDRLSPTGPVVLVPCSLYLVRSSINSNARRPWLCAVEEFNLGKFLLRKNQRSRYENCDETTRWAKKNFNVSNFQVKEMSRSYRLRYSKDFRSYDKAVLIVDPHCKTHPRIDDYKVVALGSDTRLRLISIKSNTIDKLTGSYNISLYDDLVNFKGKIFAIDRKGRGYSMGYNEWKLLLIVTQTVGEGSGSDRKKRLVVSNTGELYLVHRCPLYIKSTFKLYKLNEETNKWDDVDGIGADRILMVTSHDCFFVEAKYFPELRGNCVLFPRDCLQSYNHDSGDDLEVFGLPFPETSKNYIEFIAFNFEDGDCKLLNLSWPPPPWISSDTYLFNKKSNAEIEAIRNSRNRLASESNMEGAMPIADAVLTTKDDHSGKHDKEGHMLLFICLGHTRFFWKMPECSITVDIDSLPDITPKAAENAVTQTTFQGVDVCSDLVPVLEKIWMKYGNVIQDHVVQSKSLLKWALESLAKMVIILKTNSIESLNNSLVEFLSETLKDLQYLRIRVDWLAPFVHKISSN